MTDRRSDLAVLLNLAGVVFRDGRAQHLADAGFPDYTVRHGLVMRTLGDDALSLRELADRLDMSSPGALKVIDPMLTAGYLERVETSDRRIRAVQVTDRGRSARACSAAYHDVFEQDLADKVGADAVATTRAVLRTLAERGSPNMPRSVLPHPDRS